MKDYKIVSHYGIGGRNCICCGPNPSYRTKHDRMVKRRYKQKQNAELKRDLAEFVCD